MNHKYKFIKIISIVLGCVFIMILFVILLISPITKYLIEKNDIQYTNRRITMDWIYVNPFTGYVHFSNLKIYEFRSDSLFFNAKSVNLTLNVHKLFSNTFELSRITLIHPVIIVDKNKKEFNFSDIVRKLTPKNRKVKPSGLHINLLGIIIKDGIIHYRENSIPVNYFIKNVNIESPGKRWNSDSIDVKYSFFSGTLKGNMMGRFSMNVKNLNYRFEVITHQYDLRILEPYVKDLKNYGSFSAFLESNLIAVGNFKDANDVNFTGKVAIDKFHFGKNPQDDYGSFDKIQLVIYHLSPKEHKYLFDSVSLIHPTIKYEVYDHLDNIQEMFGKNGSKQHGSEDNHSKFNLLRTIGTYIAVLSKNFFHSDYKINRLVLKKGCIVYNDFTLSEKFGLKVEPITIISDSIDNQQDRVNVNCKCSMVPSGSINITLSLNPKDSADFDLTYHFNRIPATLFNPYLITHTSYPLNRGIIELNGAWKVRNSTIKSKNHLEIIDPHLSTRVQRLDTKWLPMGLILAIIRDRGNVIDYQIPISGNLKSPKFHLKDILLNALENIIVKPITTPYRIHVKNVEAEIHNSLSMKWELNQCTLDNYQKKFVNGLVDYLSKNPQASIEVHPKLYVIKEEEYILLFEGKKKFYMSKHHIKGSDFNLDDSTLVDKMSIRAPLFTQYLENKTKGNLLFTIQEKCYKLLGSSFINAKFVKLTRERENNFKMNFIKRGVGKQLKFTPAENVIPFNGYSFFKITYNGELPTSLITAYHQMNELNNREPRLDYKKERKKTMHSK